MGSIFRNIPVVTKNLLIINFLVWLAMTVFQTRYGDTVEYYGALHYFSSSQFVPSQLITYMFMHADFWHLFFNMFALFMFGGIIERVLGPARFLFFFVSCGLGAAFIQEGVFALMIQHKAAILPDGTLAAISDIVTLRNGVMYYNPDALAELASLGVSPESPVVKSLTTLINTPVIGASGAVYGILLAFGFIFPRRPIYLMFIPVPIQARWMVLGYGVIEFLQATTNNPADNVAHVAHLGGMIFALLMLIYWKKKGVIDVSPY